MLLRQNSADLTAPLPLAGINVVKRKLAAHDNLKLIISQEGSKFTIKESSAFRTAEIAFDLGVTFNYSLADGTELTVSFHSKAFWAFLPPLEPLPHPQW